MRHIVRFVVTESGLGMALAFIAGAINAGGFLLVGRYTSHMSGIVSGIADDLVVGATELVIAGLAALLAFVAGAACSAMLINWGRRHPRHNPYALPLLLESLLLLLFGLLGGLVHAHAVLPTAVPLLCFMMGLQNATITKISGARIRTTHVTGIVTDIGIELGKLAYWNRHPSGPDAPFVRADRAKLRLLAKLLGSFSLGGLAGASGFAHLGFISALPLSLALLVLAQAMIRSGRERAEPGFERIAAAPAPPEA
jgi:uncharacterized membrane protein YoaK (UPF0700 family)